METITIKSAQYTLTVKMRPRGRGRRSVETTVDVALAWAVPLRITMELPDDAEDLREMIHAARRGAFADWLASQGYDQYGHGRGSYGRIAG